MASLMCPGSQTCCSWSNLMISGSGDGDCDGDLERTHLVKPCFRRFVWRRLLKSRFFGQADISPKLSKLDSLTVPSQLSSFVDEVVTDCWSVSWAYKAFPLFFFLNLHIYKFLTKIRFFSIFFSISIYFIAVFNLEYLA
jgi:hypothetical protein